MKSHCEKKKRILTAPFICAYHLSFFEYLRHSIQSMHPLILNDERRQGYFIFYHRQCQFTGIVYDKQKLTRQAELYHEFYNDHGISVPGRQYLPVFVYRCRKDGNLHRLQCSSHCTTLNVFQKCAHNYRSH